jgi:hypothetical protein
MTFLLANWKLVLAGLAVLGLITLGCYIRLLQSDNKRLASEAQTSQALVASLGSSLLKSQLALKIRTELVNKLDQEKSELKQKLEAVYETDPEARDWANCSVPNSILNQLRQNPANK